MYKHIYYIFNACDTDCACGYERTITHNYDTPNKDDEHHWNECECGAIDSKVEHSYNTPNSDETHHWNECSCGAIDSKIENTPEESTETTEETTEEITEEITEAPSETTALPTPALLIDTTPQSGYRSFLSNVVLGLPLLVYIIVVLIKRKKNAPVVEESASAN